ncbi:hypothetical protein RHE_PF00115 (plasmid) [Rhizobium etli CFN 42]|uniref:Uncharacterized protein n=1 Tax=Rhizobium etli (strain ATCC 51251 / DSM 11541 / JCM 21823 / NBRC 15573 / CFN 42) TaxID=347834 RepID=Q2JZH8_RHIEC|nr:hypothetical protein [Rhizobium etli]ABC94008.1 hypothetical protein RHE_PF00115 [Rhizobium etli CFN 42]
MMCITLKHMEQFDDYRRQNSKSLEETTSDKLVHWIRTVKWWRSRSRWQDTHSSVSVLLRAITSEADLVEQWRNTLVGEISSWGGQSLKDVSQSNFWRSYACFDKHIEKVLASAPSSFTTADLSDYEAGSFDFSTRIRAIEPDIAPNLFIIDGQQRMSAINVDHIFDPKLVRTLSLRAIRALTKRAADQIASAETTSVTSLLQLTREVLSLEVQQRVRWRIVFKKTPPSAPAPEMVREHVLGFELRTGNPPPFDSDERRKGAVAVPAVFIQASKVKHEQVCKRNSRRYLPVAVREGCRTASFRRRAQTPPSSCGCMQPAGRRRLWSNLQLAETARSTRHLGRRQVVSDLRVDRRAGSFRNTARATMKLQKGGR